MVKDKPKFNQSQYDMLMRCSEKKDMTEWNEWRKNNHDQDIELEGGDFSGWYLNGANFGWGHPRNPKRHVSQMGFFKPVYLERAIFDNVSGPI